MDINQSIFKYMKRKDIRSFMKHGTIRIGTLYDFRDEEKYGSEIGDKDEGTKTLITDGYHFLDTEDPNTIPSWYAEHFEKTFKLQEGARLQVHAKGGIRVRITEPNRYIFCASHEFDGGLIENGEYEECLEIYNPLGFFTALSNKMKNRALWLGMGKCIYRPRIILGDSDEGLEPSLIKEERYSYQKEVRSVWEAMSDKVEPIIIKAKKARYFCRIITS